MTINGFLGGLVAITAPCYWVSPLGAIAIGAIAGVLVPLGIDLLEKLKIDDPIGAVPVHGFVGIWGTLAVGLFASGDFGIPGPDGTHRTWVRTGPPTLVPVRPGPCPGGICPRSPESLAVSTSHGYPPSVCTPA